MTTTKTRRTLRLIESMTEAMTPVDQSDCEYCGFPVRYHTIRAHPPDSFGCSVYNPKSLEKFMKAEHPYGRT